MVATDSLGLMQQIGAILPPRRQAPAAQVVTSFQLR
jgi:hypothetical protein